MVSARELGTALLERWALGHLGPYASPAPLRGQDLAAASPKPCSSAPTRRRLLRLPATGSSERRQARRRCRSTSSGRLVSSSSGGGAAMAVGTGSGAPIRCLSKAIL